MKKLLSLKNDYVFKKLFSNDTEILIDLLNSVLNLSKESGIISAEIKNPDILPDEVEKKYIILDIHALDESKREYDIEMQVRKYGDYPKRTLYYLCRMYGDQLQSGENYSTLCPVIGIHFLDYKQFPEHHDFHYHFYLKDTRYPELSITDDISLHIFELPGIEDNKINRDRLQEWLYFFNHAHEEGEEAMETNYNNPMIKKTYQALKFLSTDERTRELAERREKALKDEAMFLDEAKREGKREGRKETALKLLKMNLLSIKQIADATGFDIIEIEKLKQGGT